MKVAIISDTHAGIRNSSDIFLDNAEKFYNDVFFPYLVEHGIKRIVHLGDVFDNRKFINFKALYRFRKSFLANLRKHHIHMDVIPGNHDTFYKNTNELNALKELLGHYMGEITIHMEPTVLDLNGFKLALLPWICQENEEHSMEFINTCKADWLGGHLELQGFDVLRGVQSHHGLNHKIFSRFEKVLSGHFHVGSQQDNIHYLGTQMEFTWNDCGDEKGFHVLDTATRELEKIVNPYTLFERINYDDSKYDYSMHDTSYLEGKFVKVVVINKSDLFTFDRFIDRIQHEKIHDLKIAENFNEFMGENVEDEAVSVEDTAEMLDDYVDAVDTDLDKDKLKLNMRNLLTEAQALEIA
jgi:DNA repair exonuclease SbcCD nuclease subunit